MDQAKRERLESKGWKIGTVSDFLELTSEETIFVEIKLALSQNLKKRRQKLMTQSELAAKISYSQPEKRIGYADTNPPTLHIL
ncbi:transcriptional regulator [Nostoc sp. 'Lobaria pulmonaria (5183) cyanobiont']|uniref:transcriptional regulator n=1 Tax=Nostoc sp. 'Lobaria pulmonaria (5183) cyanobiont' TaxID=1618022 RepID=UPI001F320BF7|nr:transcriptional regulator [Nostoc sp. 'Lobaria pulmonaria (5183) cyanobiont']